MEIHEVKDTQKASAKSKSRVAGWLAGIFILATMAAGAAVLNTDSNEFLIDSSENGQTMRVRFALSVLNADVHAKNDRAIEYSSAFGHTETAKVLIENGADIHADNDFSVRAAASEGDIETVRMLIEAGANIHAYGEYALLMAAYNGHTEMVELLILAGADVHARGGRIVEWARNNGHTETASILQAYMEDELVKDPIDSEVSSPPDQQEGRPNLQVGKQLATACAACHSFENKSKKMGPDLYGIIGRDIASAEGYIYSDALKNMDGNWDEEKLAEFITDPQKFAKGNTMPFPGYKDPKNVKDLIGYIKSIQP